MDKNSFEPILVISGMKVWLVSFSIFLKWKNIFIALQEALPTIFQ